MIRVEKLPLDVLGLDALSKAALAGELRVPGLIVPQNASEIPQPAERFDADARAALAETLEARLAPLEPPVAVLDSIRALHTPGACIVITGQQPGFLCSPLYQLHKALHIVRLARTLAQAWEVPVIPMFWNHADDHDVAEVHHAFLLNENLDLQKVGLSGLSSGRQPLSRVVLTEERQHLSTIAELVRGLHNKAPHRDEAVDLFLPRDGETLPRAFTRGMTRWLGHLGLVMLEPDWIRSELTHALAHMLEGDLAAAARDGAAQMLAAGHAALLDPSEAAFFYRLDTRGRLALRRGGEGFQYDGEEGSRTRVELAAEMVQAPADWSPAALTRPVVQDLCLPVAAYVGGFGELAYHAQLIPVRRLAGAPLTPFVPRFSATLVEPECARSLASLETTAGAVIAARGVLPDDEPGSAPPVVAAMREVAERAARELLAHKSALAEIDLGLAQNLKRTADQVRSLIEKTCEKAERVHQNNAGKGQRHVRRVVNSLFPRELPQERVLGPLSFVARYGRAWIDELLVHVPAVPRAHFVVQLAAETPLTPESIDTKGAP